VQESTSFNASPYCISFNKARRWFSDDRRALLLDRLVEVRVRASGLGFEIPFVMIGGGFLRPDHEPGDLDGVLFYQLSKEGFDVAAEMKSLLADARANDIDMRMIPIDADPLLLIKSAVFFAALYAADRDPSRAAKGTLLVTFAADSESPLLGQQTADL
jgi:hypothetical protein